MPPRSSSLLQPASKFTKRPLKKNGPRLPGRSSRLAKISRRRGNSAQRRSRFTRNFCRPGKPPKILLVEWKLSGRSQSKLQTFTIPRFASGLFSVASPHTLGGLPCFRESGNLEAVGGYLSLAATTDAASTKRDAARARNDATGIDFHDEFASARCYFPAIFT